MIMNNKNNVSIKLKTSPTVEDMEKVEEWLYQEYRDNDSKCGFYCNLNLIKDGLQNNKTFICTYNGEPVGVVLWTDCKKYAEIDIFVISKSFRNINIGAAFFNLLNEYFKKRGYIALSLQCEPKESVTFWRDKLGFTQCPETIYSNGKLECYKPLINITPNIETSVDLENKLELWDMEPHTIKGKALPKWTWDISGDLSKYPIIQPCDCNWNLKLTINGVTVKEGKVKYFRTDDGRTVNVAFFLFVNKL